MIGFDYDGTLVQSWTAEPLPGVAARLAAIPRGERTFIATNQAGPLWRLMTGEARYPTIADVAARLADGLTALAWRPDAILVAVAPAASTLAQPPAGTTSGEWLGNARRVRFLLEEMWNDLRVPVPIYVSGGPGWRKPQPGMLIAAQRYLDGSAVRFIGDSADDAGAADAAGARFVWADAWRAEEL